MLTIYTLVLNQLFTKMVSTRKRTNYQKKKQVSQLSGFLNNFISGNGTNVSAAVNETLEQQTSGQYNDFGRFVDSGSQNQVIENNIDDKVKSAVDKAVLIVENRMHDAFLTAIDNVVIPRIEMVVGSINCSSGHGSNSEVQNPDRRDFLGNADYTPLMSASSRLDLNTNHETRTEENFGDGDFPALRLKYDRRPQAHHSVFWSKHFRLVWHSFLCLLLFCCRFCISKMLSNIKHSSHKRLNRYLYIEAS